MFLDLVQGTMIMVQNEAKFIELARFAPYMVQDEAQKTQIRPGLKPSIRSKLSVLMIRTFSNIMAHAMIVESDQEEFQASREQQKKCPWEASRGNFQKKFKKVWPADPAQASSRAATDECPRCKRDQMGESCPFKSRACFNCGEKEHFKRNCPNATAREGPQRPLIQGRTYALMQCDAEASKSVVTCNLTFL